MFGIDVGSAFELFIAFDFAWKLMFEIDVVGTCAIEHTHARTQRAQPPVSLRWAGQLV